MRALVPARYRFTCDACGAENWIADQNQDAMHPENWITIGFSPSGMVRNGVMHFCSDCKNEAIALLVNFAANVRHK